MDAHPLADIIHFLRDIGLTVIERPIRANTVLPGIDVDCGALVVDRDALKHPGDLLHEAGHFAVVPPDEREKFHGNVGNDGGMEMGAIAWSYAASLHLGMPIEALFHASGYRGNSASLIENFSAGRYLGVPILTWRGLTHSPEKNDTNEPCYPRMKRWLTAADWAQS